MCLVPLRCILKHLSLNHSLVALEYLQFGMVAFAWYPATSFGDFHIFSACGCVQEFPFLSYHAVSTRLFFVKITNCVDFSSPLPSFFHLRLLSCSYCCFPACWVYLMSSCTFSLLCDISSPARSFGVSSVFTV